MTKIYNKRGNSFINIPDIDFQDRSGNFSAQNQKDTCNRITQLISQTATNPSTPSKPSLLKKCVTVLIGGALSSVGISLIKSVYTGHVTCNSNIIVNGANGLLGMFLGWGLIYKASM